MHITKNPGRRSRRHDVGRNHSGQSVQRKRLQHRRMPDLRLLRRHPRLKRMERRKQSVLRSSIRPHGMQAAEQAIKPVPPLRRQWVLPLIRRPCHSDQGSDYASDYQP